MVLWSASLGACAAGVGGETMEFPGFDAATPSADGGGPDASDASVILDADALDAQLPRDSASGSDAPPPDAASSDAAAPAAEAGNDASEGGVDANMEDSGTTTLDTGVQPDTGGDAEPDSSSPADTGAPDVTPPAPVNCGPIARTGVQLCDMSADSCGAVFTNSAGCTAVCATAGLVCTTAYENVENQCARDDARPTLPCDSGHQSDYCLCKRP